MTGEQFDQEFNLGYRDMMKEIIQSIILDTRTTYVEFVEEINPNK